MIRLRLLGCQVAISFWFVAMLSVTILMDKSGYGIAGVFAAIIHECGHLAAMAGMGGMPKQVTFGMFNIDIVDKKREERSYRQDVIILLAGAGANLIAALFLWLGEGAFLQIPGLWAAITANLMIGIFNLLPIESLDGGQILYALLSVKFTQRKAGIAVQMISFCILLPMAIVGFLVLLRSKYNFSLLLISCYLMGLLLLKRNIYE